MPKQNDQPPAADQQEPKATDLQETKVETRHSVTINGETIHYTATTGTLVLRDFSTSEAQSKASIFYVAYIKDRAKDDDASTRPITFSFNGGPGSSSVWLHMGVLGPRRVWMDEEGFPPPPPYRLVDNEFSILDKTDLVFIDPVSTGFSRAPSEDEAKEYHNVEQDVESVAEFIRLYVTRNERWGSPKFLAGESYGTTRAVGLTGHLQDELGMYLNGLMLISVVLNFQTLSFQHGNELPYALFLPTYTATAWYHNKLSGDLQQGTLRSAVAEAEAFALGDYTLALMRGDALADEERTRIAQEVARLTGLSQAYVERANLRIRSHRFMKELRRDEGLTVGRIDSRYTGRDRDDVGEMYEYDPTFAYTQAPYTAAFNRYVRGELRFEQDMPYAILASLYESWNFKKQQNQFLDVSETLRRAIHKNPHLRVYAGNGYYDLATPHLATEYTMNHLALDPALRGNITMSYYDAGHMMYVHQASLAQMKQDLDAFVEEAIGGDSK